jgi:hypothetical protein
MMHEMIAVGMRVREKAMQQANVRARAEEIPRVH